MNDARAGRASTGRRLGLLAGSGRPPRRVRHERPDGPHDPAERTPDHQHGGHAAVLGDRRCVGPAPADGHGGGRRATGGSSSSAEQAGRVRVIQDGKLLEEPLIDISEHVLAEGERGLLGITVHPDFATNGQYYLMYSDTDGHTEIRVYGPDIAPRNGQNIGDPPPSGEPPLIPGNLILMAPQYRVWHKGGDLHFGSDGYLYVSIGEDGRQDYEPTDPRQMKGAILRLDVDDEQAWRYAIPPDNPFAEADGAPEIWDYGLRNPWRFSFDSLNGDLYIGDVGQSTAEEINRHPASEPGGLDYGWIRTEGLECREPDCDTNGITWPIVSYGHDEGDCAIVGGYVVRVDGHPLEGRYLYADLCSGKILVGGSRTRRTSSSR